MPLFSYHAIDLSGRVTSGDLTADDEADARDQLRSLGLSATTLREVVPVSTAGPSAVALNQSEQAELARQVGDLVSSQVPLPIGLRALAEEVPSSSLRQVFLGMSQDLEAGMAVELVFSRWSTQLPSYVTGMIHASNKAGGLGQGLLMFADFLRQRAQYRQMQFHSLLYPVTLFAVIGLLCCFLLLAVVPQFKSVFEGFGMELPSVTFALLRMSDLLMTAWPLLFVIPFLVVWAYRAALRSPVLVQFLYLIPFFGPILRFRGLSDFSLLLSMMIHNGVRLPEALRLAGEGSTDSNIRQGAWELTTLVQSGLSLADAAASLPHFGNEFVHAVSVGRSESELCESLRMSCDQFTAQTGLRLRLFVMAMEPVLILSSGFFVGFVVLSLFMPLIKLLNDLS